MCGKDEDGAGITDADRITAEFNAYMDEPPSGLECYRIVASELDVERCRHAKYHDGHCSNADCPSYSGRCARHAPYGRPSDECPLDVLATLDQGVVERARAYAKRAHQKWPPKKWFEVE